MILPCRLPAERLNRAGCDEQVLQPLLGRIRIGKQVVPSISGRHEHEAEVVNVAIELPMLESARVFFGRASPLRFAGALECQPHHPRIKSRTPVGPDRIGPRPDSVLGVNGRGLSRSPFRKHPFELANADFKRLLEPHTKCFLVNTRRDFHEPSPRASLYSSRRSLQPPAPWSIRSIRAQARPQPCPRLPGAPIVSGEPDPR